MLRPSRGQRQVRGFAPEKRRMFHQRHFSMPVPRRVVPFPPGRWPWKAHDVTQDTHDIIQLLWRFWKAFVAHVAASGGPRGPNVLLQEDNIALERANVTLKGYEILIFA
jgi:hypothetical protein